MRLHRLEMTAFGPFAQTAVVDFDALGADGLFLLHGHTGAGKTTVLDAVAFALYGRVPGARNESKRLHSDHADPQTAPRVSLEATIGGRRLRLIRSPEFQRPKKRGDGWRTENASATLEWLDVTASGGVRGQHLSRIPDIGDEIVRLLGMSAEQFFQVVLLPQGDFARFLRSDNEGREELLEKLFDTERFGTAERWLDDRRKAGAAELDAAQSGIERLISLAGAAAGRSAAESVEPADAVAWSEQLLETVRATAAATFAELQRSRAEADQAMAAAATERRRHDLRRRAAAARSSLADLAATAPHRATLQADLDRARRAEPVATALADARTAATAWRRRGEATTTIATRLAERLLDAASAELPGTYWAATDLAAAELSGTPAGESLSRIARIDSDDAEAEHSASTAVQAAPAPRGPVPPAVPPAQPRRRPAAERTTAATDSHGARKKPRAGAARPAAADMFAAEGLWADGLWADDAAPTSSDAAEPNSGADLPAGAAESSAEVSLWAAVQDSDAELPRAAADSTADQGLWAAESDSGAELSRAAAVSSADGAPATSDAAEPDSDVARPGALADSSAGVGLWAAEPDSDAELSRAAAVSSADGAPATSDAAEPDSDVALPGALADSSAGVGLWAAEPDSGAELSRVVADSSADEGLWAADELWAAQGGSDAGAVQGSESATVGRSGSAVVAEPGLETAIRLWTAQIGSLDGMRSEAADADRLGRESARLHSELAGLTEKMRVATGQRMELPEALRIAELEHRRATEAAAAVPGLQAEWERLTAATAAATELVGCRAESARATAEFETARAAHTDAREHTLDVRERRLAGMAAELAGGLTDGTPCLVCGSAEHPAPALPTSAAVSRADEDQAVAAERVAEGRRDRALQRCTELQRRIEVLVERGGDGDPAELAAALRAAAQQRDDAGREAAREGDLTVRLTRLRSDETRLQEELQDLEGRIAAARQGIAAADERLTELTTRLQRAAGADSSVDRRRDRLTALIADATALRTARADKSAALEHVLALAVNVEQHAAAAGLALDAAADDTAARGRDAAADLASNPPGSAVAGSEAGAAAPAPTVLRTGPDGEPDFARLAALAKVVDAATRTAAQQAAIEAELVEADRARAHAETVLADPDIQELAEIEPGDPDLAEAAAAAARTRQDAAVAAHADAERRLRELSDLSSQLWAAVDRIAPVRAAHEELAGLAQVVAGRGENNRRMSLRSYVLAARLEEVAVAGSARLRRMSGGRYEFVHTDAAGRHGRRGGLGLDVRDDYTGAVRPAKTLSGGETFMASLALALGLADVVAAESGGMVLDTLFIDEGFGSLDSDTLDAVMGVLDELRSGGRVVGVVSHVDEMRQRIPSRLHVIRDSAGSRLQATTA
ncbi:AAA family ATPase [Nocardia stercoris]|nr:AAA family ATPase [Nocardia stercoris]